ncbi:hypothetical protein ABZP36_002330 [Zizania latifolia]
MAEKGRPWMAEGLLLPASMALVQAFTIGALILSKLAFNVGMAPFVLLTYRNLIAAVTVSPFAFWFEREMMKKVSCKVLGLISINALFGIVLAMGLHYYGLRATNAAYTVNFLNLIPVVTFVIAAIFRLEKLRLRTCPGTMKVIGTVICVGGTMVISLYKGKLLHLWPTHLLKQAQLQAMGSDASPFPGNHNMLVGTLFLCGSCLSYAFWFIVQAKVSKEFPSKYVSTMLACLLGTVQSVVIGIAIDPDTSAWALKWDLQLLTVIYSGVFNTAASFCLISWAVARRGPTYPSMFNSLSLIVTVVLDSVLLGSDVSVGSLLGAFMIIVGLYAFLWGKGKEMKRQQQICATTDLDRRKSVDATNDIQSMQIAQREVRIPCASSTTISTQRKLGPDAPFVAAAASSHLHLASIFSALLLDPMGFPAVYYCVFLPPPLHSLLHLLECISRSCALPGALLFSGDGDGDVGSEQLPSPAGAQLADGIKSRLPVVRFTRSGAEADDDDDDDADAADDAPRCAVCLATVEEGAEVRQLGNCSHAFHLPCIDRWVDMGHITCPLCRSLV